MVGPLSVAVQMDALETINVAGDSSFALMLSAQGYRLSPEAEGVMARYIALRRGQPHFANARSIRNALDRARLRQANRLFTRAEGPIDAGTLSTIEAEDISVSRVFSGGLKIGAGETENDV